MSTTRVVETAIDDYGDSYIYSDDQKSGWELPGHVITDLFFSNQNPPDMLAKNIDINDKNFNLKPGQIRFFRSDVYPTEQVYAELPMKEKPAKLKDLFYHSTITVDYIIIVKGEIAMQVGDKQVVLKAGDTVVQRGAAHAWHNYTNEVASIMGVMIGVEVPEQFIQVDTVQPD